ncbi:MAG: hypothetical protein Q8N45_02290 [Anaerolineales bacterium]|nr:hypothetical protein [Anaerolineales bacterium]
MEKLNRNDIAFNDRIFELTEQFNHYVFAHPDVLDEFPEQAILVLLDPEDEAFNRANIELAKSAPHPPDAPIVYIRMEKRVIQQVEWTPSIVSSPLAV